MKFVLAIAVLFNNGVPLDAQILGVMDTMEHCQQVAHVVFEKDRTNIPEGMQLQIKCVDYAQVPLTVSGFGPKRTLKPAPGEQQSE